MNLDNDWLNYLNGTEEPIIEEEKPQILNRTAPIASDLYISTKTEIVFLNQEIELNDIFWKIPISNYDEAKEAVIKKQMKFISNTKEQHDIIQEHLKKYSSHLIEQQILSEMKADIGKKKYKDVRKISIGLSKKDMLTNRTKKKRSILQLFCSYYTN